ncbi:hypothetical protein [Peterkaempfera bronchialis]|uniref:Uncharacterized protein n=1 Tax=Peterkaempfera bronchialis TaxID=2126346 RepID=A0A345SX66_9ACTN|nr:hypothetical protein [Peterkaempfera bronchialis]AXI78321.1 hypothetical protein C7M71_013590 [Peterkaempfera bronchialis]
MSSEKHPRPNAGPAATGCPDLPPTARRTTLPPEPPEPPEPSAPPAPPSGGDRPVPGPLHQVEVSENGSFCTARCTCGWFAPARRSRDRARRDATEHTAA